MQERTSWRGIKDDTEEESWVRVAVELPVKCKMLSYSLHHLPLNRVDSNCCQAHGCAAKAQPGLTSFSSTQRCRSGTESEDIL